MSYELLVDEGLLLDLAAQVVQHTIRHLLAVAVVEDESLQEMGLI